MREFRGRHTGFGGVPHFLAERAFKKMRASRVTKTLDNAHNWVYTAVYI
jgi:hypothetical protein